MKGLFVFFISLFVFLSQAKSQCNNRIVDSLYHLGVSSVSFNLDLARECSDAIESNTLLDYVDKAHLNYLNFKIYKRELRMSGHYNQIPGRNEVPADTSSQWQKGLYYLNNGNSPKGLSILIHYVQNSRSTDSLTQALQIVIANEFRANNDFSKAIELYHKVIDNENVLPYNKTKALNRLAAAYDQNYNISYLQRADSVKKYTQRSIELAIKYDYLNLLAVSQNEMASYYRLNNNDLDSAEYYASLAFNNFIKSNDLPNAMNSSILISNLFLKRGNTEQAIKPLERVHDYLPFRGNEELFFRLYLQMAKVNEKLGDFYRAYEFLSVGRLLQEKTFNSKLDRQINELAARYELGVKEADIKEKEYQIRYQRNRIVILFLIIVVLFTSLLTGWLYYDRHKQKIQYKHQLEIAKNEKLLVLLEDKNNDVIRSLADSVEKNRILEDLKHKVAKGSDHAEVLKVINANINTEQNWDKVLLSFNSIYPDFITNLKQRHPDFTKNEIKLCILTKLNMTTSEIARLLSVSADAVKKNRQRLRKKLYLDSSLKLSDYIRKAF